MVLTFRKTIRELVFSNRQLAKLYYSVSLTQPVLPHWVGADYYRSKSSWELQPHLCPCDIELNEYLQKYNIQDQSIFHFGTGSHHIVGLENQKLDKPNEILGITASIPEHEEYVSLCRTNRQLGKFYKVIWSDIYTLTPRSLPMLDVVSLFHLGEFYMPEEAPFVHHNDESLVELFLSKLNPGGKILFYTKSVGWGKAEEVIELLTSQGKIKKIEEYKHLLVYAKGY
ncbi:hypothetical protein A0J48_022145 [Sphaerospermopsis aphanizomenoides BCCUSP55]|uniref:hypothetical protein n=1 Tax=Sphaerospermopsis aphanizomenoides TaxID=459663 RepID=UPI000AA3C1E7|nr:hypothetical protein [Sphaerospermopsis aphanizomenoides]MBK1990192.1 hypothetical protein [Sphaerospermopsis aphanizomenoides BCCUSP55]